VRIKHIAIVATMAALTGCATVEYPKGWSPQLESTSQCISIAGTYQNVPSAVFPEGAPTAELRQFLLVGRLAPTESQSPQFPVKTVTIEQDGEGLTIAERSDGGIRTSRLGVTTRVEDSANGVVCKRSALARAYSRDVAVYGPIWLSSEHWIWFLLRGQDGSLVVQLASGTVNMGLFVPYGHQTTVWYRYDPVR
jgi:hypothetical protein